MVYLTPNPYLQKNTYTIQVIAKDKEVQPFPKVEFMSVNVLLELIVRDNLWPILINLKILRKTKTFSKK